MQWSLRAHSFSIPCSRSVREQHALAQHVRALAAGVVRCTLFVEGMERCYTLLQNTVQPLNTPRFCGPAWRNTVWWRNTNALNMEMNAGNHTKWKHKWRWHNRGCVCGTKLRRNGQVKQNAAQKLEGAREREDKLDVVTFCADVRETLGCAHMPKKLARSSRMC